MVKKTSYKIVWDNQVLDHFIDILAYLKKQSTQAPKIVKDGVLLKLDLIKTNPLICELDNLKDPSDVNYRAFVVFSYRITYQIISHKKEVRIIRLRHYEYCYGNVLVLSFDKDGNNEWSQKVQKFWSTINVSLPIELTMPVMTKGEDSYFLYRGDNSKEIKDAMKPGEKNGSVFMTKFDAAGKEAVVPLLKKLDVPGWLTYLSFAPGSNDVYGMKFVRGTGFAFCKVLIKE